ncbi:hypothetical protein J4N45_26520 [Vibrio sp. SCSIO 43140]|uniref:hypothetical protein n=1 Tax=Vibrio sp. SCSIO 43140 TaxID=2819100 RepID=UPI002075E567|nr:hypothetical protein [Vibrio sp. SCSIO 43140]USD62910.1 hypothetical protein J4N45_26520 [Vibrio sp. SCSIO 43140]
MQQLDEFEDFSFELDECDIEYLGWNDKEWLIELGVFLLILVAALFIAAWRWLQV